MIIFLILVMVVMMMMTAMMMITKRRTRRARRGVPSHNTTDTRNCAEPYGYTLLRALDLKARVLMVRVRAALNPSI